MPSYFMWRWVNCKRWFDWDEPPKSIKRVSGNNLPSSKLTMSSHEFLWDLLLDLDRVTSFVSIINKSLTPSDSKIFHVEFEKKFTKFFVINSFVMYDCKLPLTSFSDIKRANNTGWLFWGHGTSSFAQLYNIRSARELLTIHDGHSIKTLFGASRKLPSFTCKKNCRNKQKVFS